MKLARQRADQLVRADRSLICIYLTGSLITPTPLLGGVTDIDLICVHAEEPAQAREVLRLSDEVHLDLAHYSQSVFHQPRRLRLDPWVGSYLCHNPLLLYETQHWFEFTQASVAAQFDQAETVMQRVRPLAEAARQTWFDLQNDEIEPGPQRVWAYLKALENAANALAGLSGPPLTERRFILDFPARADAIGRPGLAAGLADLLMVDLTSTDVLKVWHEQWVEALTTAGKQPSCPPRLLPPRRNYYARAAAAMLDDYPAAALWIMLRTWTQVVKILPAALPDWQSVCAQLGLEDDSRLGALDAYLDAMEETLDNWAAKYGVAD
jgi:hypothetical protein